MHACLSQREAQTKRVKEGMQIKMVKGMSLSVSLTLRVGMMHDKDNKRNKRRRLSVRLSEPGAERGRMKKVKQKRE